MGPGWVEYPEPPHPKSAMVVLIPDVVGVFTPCHGAPKFYSPAEAKPAARLKASCSDCARRLVVELIADSSQEFGLRAEWSEASKKGGGR